MTPHDPANPLLTLARRLFDLLERVSVLIIVCVIPAGALFLLLYWIAGPYRLAALPLAVALGILALLPVSASMSSSQNNQRREREERDNA